jgi:hypothetical protein
MAVLRASVAQAAWTQLKKNERFMRKQFIQQV